MKSTSTTLSSRFSQTQTPIYDGEPLVDDEGEMLLPCQEGETYTETKIMYLTAFASAYQQARKALQHTRTGREYSLVGKFKSNKHGAIKQKKVLKK